MECLNGLLIELIRIDSSTKQGANRAIDYCKQWLLKQGLNVREVENRNYRMLICQIGKGEKTLIWNGHVDVVSGKPDQFQPYEKDGKLYGRGAADMKAGVAALMCAVEELKDQNLNCRIQLQLVSDEETGGHHCSSYLAENGYTGDFVICPEPTQLGIGLEAKGVLQLDLTVKGRSAHGSRPWEGDNAIVKAYDLFNQIQNLPFAKESSEWFQNPSINLSKIRGGEVYNKVPDSCLMSLDIRFLPSQNKHQILNQIQSVTDCEMSIHLYGDPVKNSKEDPYVRDVISVIEKVTQTKKVKIFGQHGFADTRFFSKFDIPAIEFGPCGENWHGDEEFVVLDSVRTYQKILVRLALLQSQREN